MANTVKTSLLLACVTIAIYGIALAPEAPGKEPPQGSTEEQSHVQPAEVERPQEPEVAQNPQVTAREATFKEVSEALKQATEIGAGLLSPKYFAEGQKSFEMAQAIYDKGGKLADVRSRLAKSMQDLQLAIRTAEMCRVALKEVLALRDEVLASGLSVNRSNDFREAEMKVGQAAEKIEKGDLKGSRKPSDQAAERYRRAVLQVLEKQVIPDAMKKLKDIKTAYTKEDYKQAEDSLKNLEQYVKAQKQASFSVAELTSKVNEVIRQALKQPAPGSQSASPTSATGARGREKAPFICL